MRFFKKAAAMITAVLAAGSVCLTGGERYPERQLIVSAEESGSAFQYTGREDGTICITWYTGKEEYVQIPDEIDGKVVTMIGGAYSGFEQPDEAGAFEGNTIMIGVTIPDTVTEIGSYAFGECEKLRNVRLPASVNSVAPDAFAGCTELTAIEVDEANQTYTSADGVLFSKSQDTLTAFPAGRKGSYIIPDTVTVIGPDAFKSCSGLTEIRIPDSVRTIDSHAFKGCTGLTSLQIPEGVTAVREMAFQGCTGLKTAVIADSVAEMERRCFWGCTSLEEVNIPNGTNTIAEGFFSECTSLVTVRFHQNVNAIGEYAFTKCTGLTGIHFPDSLTEIGPHAFQECSGLTGIVIPDSVTKLGAYAFAQCTLLEQLSIPDSISFIGDHAFWETAWYDRQPDGVIYIGGLLYGYKGRMPSHTTLVIPEGVTRIIGSAAKEGGAFFDCTELTAITLPDSLTAIDSSAFYGCTGLTSIVLPPNLSTIKMRTFYGCTELERIEIPVHVTEIERMAFLDCDSLTDIYYTGSESEWKAIAIEGPNQPLKKAAVHYQSHMPENPTEADSPSGTEAEVSQNSQPSQPSEPDTRPGPAADTSNPGQDSSGRPVVPMFIVILIVIAAVMTAVIVRVRISRRGSPHCRQDGETRASDTECTHSDEPHEK